MKSIRLTQIWLRGYDAAIASDSFLHPLCPYSEGNAYFEAWMTGWNQAWEYKISRNANPGMQ